MAVKSGILKSQGDRKLQSERRFYDFNIIYSKNSPSSTGGRWIAKNKKERLFDSGIHGTIESVDKVDKINIQKKDWFYGKNRS